MVGNHTGEGEVGVSRGKGTEHIEVDGRPKRGVEIASQGTAFITKWRASALKERSASQEHFIDLCHLLDEPTPAEADPSGETYCFERGARKDTGGDGWADVWKRHHFAWGVQGAARGPRHSLRPAPAVLAGVGEPAAADRVRHGAVPDPHQLDEQRQLLRGRRVRACLSDTPGENV